MSSNDISEALFAGGLVLALALFYRTAMNDINRPKGFCLLLLRAMCLATLCTFSSVILMCVLADPAVKKEITSFAFICALVAVACIFVGNLFNCGKNRLGN